MVLWTLTEFALEFVIWTTKKGYNLGWYALNYNKNNNQGVKLLESNNEKIHSDLTLTCLELQNEIISLKKEIDELKLKLN